MKIYFLSQWYFPEPDGRVSELAEALVKKGHDVSVITGFPNYPIGKVYPGYKITLFKKEPLLPVNSNQMVPIMTNISEKIIKEVFEKDEDFKFYKRKT